MPLLTSLITAVYHLIFLATPFVFTWVNSELFQINKMMFVYGAAIVVGALWLTRMILEKRIIWKKHPTVILLLVFLVGQAAATLFSIHFRTSLLGYYSRLNGGFLSSLTYALLFLGLINNVPKKQMFSLLLTNLVAAALISLYAIPEHFGVSPSCYLMFQEFNVNCWKQDVQSRVFASFGQPNWLAAYLVALLPVAFLFIKKQQDKLRRLWIAIAGLMLLTLWYTGSRSGLIGLVASIVAFGWFYHRQKITHTIKKWFRSPKTGIIMTFGAMGAVILMGMAGYRLLFPINTDQFDLSQGTESASIRLIVWRGAAKVWARYPWFGSGPGTFGYSYYQDRLVDHNLTSEWDNLYNKAHNEPLNYLAETGIVGLTGYLFFLLGILWLLQKKLSKSSKKISATTAVMISIIGLSATHLFGFSTVTTNLLLFTLPALAFLEEQATTSRKKKLVLWQKIGLALIILLVATLLTSVTKIWQADRLYEQSKKFQVQSDYAAALPVLQRANQLVPKESLYYDELADVYSKLALQYFLIEENEASEQLAEAAIQNSDYALKLNPWQLNFYKTRVRVFFLLAQIDSSYYGEAEHVLKTALDLAPTDAQLWYNLGITQQSMGKFSEAIKTLEYTIIIRPNYIKARSELGDLLIQLGRVEEGRFQYQFILENLSSTDQVIRQKINDLERSE